MLVSLTVAIIVQLYAGAPRVWWYEPGTSCAAFFDWEAAADAWARRNRIEGTGGPHGSCTPVGRTYTPLELDGRPRPRNFFYMPLPARPRPGVSP
jgi:hypothetical protein